MLEPSAITARQYWPVRGLLQVAPESVETERPLNVAAYQFEPDAYTPKTWLFANPSAVV